MLLYASCTTDKDVELQKGMIINRSMTIKKDTFFLSGADTSAIPAITIEGDDIVVDFNGAVLIGSQNYDHPDMFSGLGIEVRNGKNITIKNVVVRGYKVGLIATGIDSLKILDSDFSYNYRQKLKSTREKEDLDDWMSYHQNDQDEWLRYGMAIYLRECDHALVRNLKVTSGQNGLMMTACNHGLFYNNYLSFNSGLGLGMYRSSFNKIMHNNLDWNIRGFSFGVYNRGQDSAGILLYEQCSENTIAYNSATHSGDGFFLWAGQYTMDSGKGGCNNNLVFENDFSYASNNGIEVTFSGGNKFYKNKLFGCDYGIWGGYSYEMEIVGNKFENNNHSIAIEHGNNTKVSYNLFAKDKIGIKLFERDQQPRSWYFANNRNVASRSYQINDNIFSDIKEPFQIEKTGDLTIKDNVFSKASIVFDNNETSSKETLENNFLAADEELVEKRRNNNAIIQNSISSFPIMLKDGIDPFLKEGVLQGRQYMIMGEFGPYNFKYPALWLRKIESNTYTFVVFGPFGNWKAVGGEGFKIMSQKTGSVPATLVLEAEDFATNLSVELEFLGDAFTDEFGLEHRKGKPVKLSWKK
jgi:parallel beta-helix repeat protein